MNLTRDEMREYQRARRARLKAEALTVSNPRSTSIQTPRPPGELPPGSGSRMLPVSPRSTYACGGRAGSGLVDCGPGYPLPPDQFVASPLGRWKANVETMLVALAAKTDAQQRRIAELERKAALDEKMSRQLAKAAAGLIEELFGIKRPRRRA